MRNFINFVKFIKNYFVFSLLAVIFIASSWSLIHPEFFRVHDYVHASRIAEMTQALNDGHFPVRWSQNFGYGFGMPLFEFYAPLPFYVGSFFYWLGIDLVICVKLLFLITNLGSLFGAYKLGKKLWGINAGLLLSAAFTLAPYRAVNLFVRGALSEAWGIMAMPWILLGVVTMVDSLNSSNKKLNSSSNIPGWFYLTIGLVVLMLSHNLTTLMFVPFSFIFALGYLFMRNHPTRQNIKTLTHKLTHIIGAYLLGGGLSAFYLLPAFIEKKFTQIETILGGYFHYSNHFLYIRQFLQPQWGFGGSGWGPDDEISFFLGYAHLFALGIAAILTVNLTIKLIHQLRNKKVKNKSPQNLEQLFKIIVEKVINRFCHHEVKPLFGVLFYTLTFILLALSLFMTLLKSQFLWNNLPLLNFIQFPWRFLSVSTILIALLVAFNFEVLNKFLSRHLYFIVIFWALVLGNFYYFRPEKYMDDATALYYDDPHKVRISMSDVLKDYVPVQMSLEGEVLKKQYAEFTLPEKTIIEIDKTHQKLYQIDLPKSESSQSGDLHEEIIALPVANFPGWKAEVDGQKVDTHTVESGLLAVNIPEGKHQVGIYFGYTPIRLMADIISGLSLIALVGLMLKTNKKS